jgi:hypothetical protein
MAKKYTAAQKKAQRAKEARRRASMPNPIAPLSGVQFAALLDRQVAGAIQPGRQEIARARKESQRLTTEGVARTQGLAEAYATLLKEVAPATETAYGNARDAQAALARGFSADQTSSQQKDAAAAAELLNRIGAPAGQTQQVQGVGAGVGNVSYGLGGYIPSTALNEQGAAFGAQARQLPAYALGRGQEQVGALRRAQQTREKELDEKLADIMAQVPGLRAKYYSDLAGAENAKEATRIQKEYLGIAGQRQELSEFETIANVTGIDPTTGQPTVAARNAAQKTVGKGKANRQAAFDANRTKAFDAAAVLAQGTKNTNPATKYTKPVIKPTYKQAYSKLWSQYGQPLLRYAPANGKAWWRRQVTAFIKTALRENGFKPAPKRANPPLSKIRPG